MGIIINGNDLERRKNLLFRGHGMVSGNNSSRLLPDYKAEHPEIYEKLLKLIFGREGLAVNHLKLEMGSDINSSSGTEPCVKRFPDEKADVTRGAGYQLAADAKKINPELTVDMLWWSEPKWCETAEDRYDARYRWYKETLDAAYENYGLKFDYLSLVRNERDIEYGWIKYFAARIKQEKDMPYDYSKIKIVCADEENSWHFADAMINDRELIEIVDVIGSHYTSRSPESAQRLCEEYGKELWHSEAAPPMSYSRGACRFDSTGSGMSDINGILDIANRFIAMFPQGKMTMCEYQPVISAYYDGVCYCHKHLISACDPWSGHYVLDSGYYMAMHFSQFFRKGWCFAKDGCFCDGVPGGDGHAIVNAAHSYMSAADPETGDYSVVITNTTDSEVMHEITVSGIAKADCTVNVYETTGGERGYFEKREEIAPKPYADGYAYTVRIKPYSLVTLSTLMPLCGSFSPEMTERPLLTLPYSDDYEYSDKPSDYLPSRGYAPRYTTDQGGAFEVANVNGENRLMQMITPEMKASEWGYTPDPTTNFGDDRWFDYSASVDVYFALTDAPADNYAGIGVRYSLACVGQSGYSLTISENGGWRLCMSGRIIKSGCIDGFDGRAVHRIRLDALGNTVTGYIDGECVCSYTFDKEAFASAGRAALFSSMNKNSFKNFLAEPINGCTYITRFDDTDSCVRYGGKWEHTTMSSFRHYRRTISKGFEGAFAEISFEGTGIILAGENTSSAEISAVLDGGEAVIYVTPASGPREAYLYINGLENRAHTLKITVLSGELCLDNIEITEMGD